jgi:hypothetical protein
MLGGNTAIATAARNGIELLWELSHKEAQVGKLNFPVFSVWRTLHNRHRSEQ